jgi:hypothetical protein
MVSFNIPWKCLDLESEPTKTIINQPNLNQPKTPKTFVQALSNVCDIPLSQLPQPVVKGDRLAIEIPEVAYQVGLDACKHNLHGRILWPKGSSPLSVVALKAKLSSVWKDFSKWGLISLGKGFYEFTFSTLEDVRRVRSVPSWSLNPGLLKLFAWSKDFNPKAQQNTFAQLWVKFYGLSQEYWHKNILFTIVGSLGTPICMDSVTARPMHERTFGQFARVLVDIDISQPLRNKVLVERKGFAFFVEIDYENVPDFCNACQVIGHHVDNCRRWNNEDEGKTNKEIIAKKQVAVDAKKTYVQTRDGRPQQQKQKENEVINVESHDCNVIVIGGNSEQENAKGKGFEHNSLEENPQLQIEIVNTALLHKDSNLPKQKTPVYNEVVVLSPILTPEAIFKEQDLQLETDLNANVEVVDGLVDSDVSSDSFVDATQQHLGTPSATNACADSSQVPDLPTKNKVVACHSNSSSDQIQTPDRVKKDMVFLKNSWAAMAEEEDEIQQVPEQDLTHPDDGFTMNISKHQKKIQRKKNHSSKESYATRSKVSLKPFR